jgi:hypothetical protein
MDRRLSRTQSRLTHSGDEENTFMEWCLLKHRDNSTFFTFTFYIHTDDVKVNLSLCLTKHHAIKTYSFLNDAPCHEGILGSGGIVPRLLNFGMRWR